MKYIHLIYNLSFFNYKLIYIVLGLVSVSKHGQIKMSLLQTKSRQFLLWHLVGYKFEKDVFSNKFHLRFILIIFLRRWKKQFRNWFLFWNFQLLYSKFVHHHLTTMSNSMQIRFKEIQSLQLKAHMSHYFYS